MSRGLTEQVLEGDEPVHRFVLVAYARRRHELDGYPKWLAPGDHRRVGRHVEFVLPYENYGFLSIARADFEAVNGYDMRYEAWGGEDIDLAMRLRHNGLRCSWPGPSATLFHLWHPSRKHEKRYLSLLRECRDQRRVEAIVGFRELAAEEHAGVADSESV
ncbi:MAG: galactosyltransferase-related protein [Thermoleophilia bacterium]|nr:galactosyltransferase-related protein [Thermoleophilia bacterium]MDH5281059.1 galactosyltransferase-related protein [Thermoleophilia bacterium]